MIHLLYLAGSIISSTIIALLFKVFGQKQVDAFQAIVINYFVCVTVGSLLIGELPVEAGFWRADWFPYALMLGVLFVSVFYFVALTVQYFGVAIAIVLQKMSIVLTVIFAIWMYNETVNALKIIGVILALLAVILTNIQSTSEKASRPQVWWMLLLPIYVFLGCGVAECLLQYAKMSVLGNQEDIRFTIFLFGTAGIIGVIVLLGNVLFGKSRLKSKNIIAGIALGVPNYFSVHFLLEVLGSGLEGSVVFPVNNISIIVLSALLAWLIFSESLSKINMAGIVLAVVSIVLIGVSS